MDYSESEQNIFTINMGDPKWALKIISEDKKYPFHENITCEMCNAPIKEENLGFVEVTQPHNYLIYCKKIDCLLKGIIKKETKNTIKNKV